ncbi:putative transcriptional regulator, TetR family protein [Nocardiopsis terrae]|uniref:AcrR family transcriptional regulator n=1 Tax=Nocardiopsis terrae TaxID=372655 RepID=A0ABR9HLD8_9ACTN|nr:TetR/AcrR family transcriptional regulator [Nocardiopsis terrae]MBE1459778.1 AcrR family transcriptional regulator [Nocardiopsis terrae]GHC94024.1 putative transcriptional regulator, TetR family protein [Nocardiopsis terrae]
MASKRNVEDEILDAARTCVEAFGVRRTTLTDVARRAGVSRPTVYRRWPDVTALVADLLTRELRRILIAEEVAAEQGSKAETVRTRLVRHAAGVARAMLAHPLVGRIVDTEPELLATYTFHRLGSSHRAALELLEPALAEGQADGSVREGDPGVLAHLFMVTVQNTVTSRRLFTEVLDQDGLVDELSALLDGYLSP